VSQLQSGVQQLSEGLSQMAQKTTLSETQQQNISAVQNGLTELNQELQKIRLTQIWLPISKIT
jgi:putative membrane protein